MLCAGTEEGGKDSCEVRTAWGKGAGRLPWAKMGSQNEGRDSFGGESFILALGEPVF